MSRGVSRRGVYRVRWAMQNLSRRGFTLSVLGALAARGQNAEDLTGLTLAEASARIRSRSVTPSQLVEACLARIRIYNPKVNAFITVIREYALAQAKQLEAEQ